MTSPRFPSLIPPILLIEDNPGDARLVHEAMKESKIANELHHVLTAELGLQFLRGQEPFVDVPRPGLILLDLNLPRMTGQYLFRWWY